MILAFTVLLSTSLPQADAVREAGAALSHGRTVQAREMIRNAVGAGASGPAVERLLADLAFAERRWAEATVRYDKLIQAGERSGSVLEHAAIAALEQGDNDAAIRLLDQAATNSDAGWRTFNIKGVLADRNMDWAAADQAYAQGLKLNPVSPELRNNLGWSLLLRGQWKQAHDHLAQAAAMAPSSERIAANLDLAASALLADLPIRRPGESGMSYAARLNDAGALALQAGRIDKARAAFARALEQSESWLVRAANNLALTGSSAPSATR
jgi:Flp pilus assembly protein TadD